MWDGECNVLPCLRKVIIVFSFPSNNITERDLWPGPAWENLERRPAETGWRWRVLLVSPVIPVIIFTSPLGLDPGNNLLLRKQSVQ